MPLERDQHCSVVEELAKYKLNEGKAYISSIFGTIPASGTCLVQIVTGSNELYANMRVHVTGSARFKIIENCDNAGGGVEVPIYNAKRSSSNTSEASVATEGSIGDHVADTATIAQGFSGAAGKANSPFGGQMQTVQEIILKANTRYVCKGEDLSGNANPSLRVLALEVV